MRVTICQSHDDTTALEADWQALIAHLEDAGSDLVLLPEMPFYPWIAATQDVDLAQWEAAVAAHDAWEQRLGELPAAYVVGSRPVTDADGSRHNRGFVFQNGRVDNIHDKVYLPNDDLFWEGTWYAAGEKTFDLVQCGEAKVGFMICTEIWFTEHARAYAKQGVHIIANPRATEAFSVDKWIAGGRAAAVMGGAYCLSSNRGWSGTADIQFGGAGWAIDPDGEVLGLTSDDAPFCTVEIDLSVADHAKTTYPRNVVE